MAIRNWVPRVANESALGTETKPWAGAHVGDLNVNGHGYRSLLAAKEPGITYSKEDAYFQSAQVDFEPGRDVACVDFQYHSSGSTGNRVFWYTTGLNPSTASDGAWGLKFHGNNLTVFVRNNGGAAGEKRRIVISSGDLTAGDIYRIKFDLKTTDDYPDLYLNGSLLTLGAETTGGDQTNVSWATIAQTGGRFFFGDLSMATTENSLKLLSLDLLYGGADLTSQEIANIESQGLPERFLRAGAVIELSNADFENDISGWTSNSAGILSHETFDTNGSSGALKISINANDTFVGAIPNGFRLQKGYGYRVKFAAKKVEGTQTVVILLNETGFGTRGNFPTGGESGWETLEAEFISTDGGLLSFSLNTDAPAGGDEYILIDSIEIMRVGKAFDLRFGNLPQLTDISGNGNHALNIDGTPDNAEDITVQYSSDLVWAASSAAKGFDNVGGFDWVPDNIRIVEIGFISDIGGYNLDIRDGSADRYLQNYAVSAGINVIRLGDADLLNNGVNNGVNRQFNFGPTSSITATISSAYFKTQLIR